MEIERTMNKIFSKTMGKDHGKDIRSWRGSQLWPATTFLKNNIGIMFYRFFKRISRVTFTISGIFTS